MSVPDKFSVKVTPFCNMEMVPDTCPCAHSHHIGGVVVAADAADAARLYLTVAALYASDSCCPLMSKEMEPLPIENATPVGIGMMPL